MLIGIIIVIVIFIFYSFLSDKQQKYEEIAKDNSLQKGILYKYPLLFEHLQNQDFTIKEVNKTKVSIYKFFYFDTDILRLDIVTCYQVNKQLQFILQLNAVKPINKHISTKSIFYNSDTPEDILINNSFEEFGNFLQTNFGLYLNSYYLQLFHLQPFQFPVV